MRNGAGWALFLEFDGTLVESCNADLVVLQARDSIEAIVSGRPGSRLSVAAESPPKLKKATSQHATLCNQRRRNEKHCCWQPDRELQSHSNDAREAYGKHPRNHQPFGK